MEELKMFGMPIAFDPTEQKLIPAKEGISWEDYNRKYSKAMFGLLADPEYQKENEAYYDFYKAIVEDCNRTRFSHVNLRYDSTVILAGDANGEFKKTAGHFHCEVPGKGMSYPELYQVIKGTALFIMQKVDDCQKTGRMVVEDAIFAEVHAGEAIVIPPEYGHATVNIGNETMVFINLVSCNSHNFYDSVKASAGMCCYVYRDNKSGYRIEKNPKYDFACEPRIVKPKESDVLGVHKNIPTYTEFLENPEKFHYLEEPENNIADYFDLLDLLEYQYNA